MSDISTKLNAPSTGARSSASFESETSLEKILEHVREAALDPNNDEIRVSGLSVLKQYFK